MKITAFIVVTVFIVFDVVSGWLKALYTGTLDSSIARKGLFHKVSELLAMVFGYVCEYCFPLAGIPFKAPIAEAIGVYIVAMETASIVENIAAMNPSLAQILSKVFSESKVEIQEAGGKHLEDKSANSGGSSNGEMG